MGEMLPTELIPKGRLEQASYFLALILFLVRPRNLFSLFATVNYLREL